MPFEHLFTPLLLDARKQLKRRVNSVSYALLTLEAHADGERYLLTRLTAAGAKAAHAQFQIFETARSVFPAENHGKRQASNYIYLCFIGSQPRDRLQKLFDEFPALKELCGVLIENWLAAVGEFLAHLQADRPELRTHFPGGSYTCPVAKLQPGLSDPHNGGRSVVRLNFADGTSLIYKPRSLVPEAHFAALLDQLNASEVPYPLKSARCWDRGEYGWMEDVPATPCSTIEEVHNFYWRAGASLGLVYLARGVDFHRENLVASGQYPVLIDLETLWHPQNRFGGDRSAMTSVLRTGFLPQDSPRSEKHYVWSALGRAVDQDPITLELAYTNDARTMRKPNGQKTEGSHHLPIFLNAPYPAAGFVGEIETGFRWAGNQVFGAGRERFKRWLSVLTNCPRRLILRSTVQYQWVLDRLTMPQHLRQTPTPEEVIAWSLHHSEPLSSAEVLALGQMDVPYLKQDSDGNDTPNAAEFEETTEELYLAQISVIASALAIRS